MHWHLGEDSGVLNSVIYTVSIPYVSFIITNDVKTYDLLEQPSVTATCPSASAAMTLPKAESDLLIFFASSNTDPSAPVLQT